MFQYASIFIFTDCQCYPFRVPISLMDHTSWLFDETEMMQTHSPFAFHCCSPHPVITLGQPHNRVHIFDTPHVVSRIFLGCTQEQAIYCRSTGLSCDFSNCLPKMPTMPLTDSWKWPKLMMSSKRKQRV